jgi:beta-glucanase (GH16 family)
MNKQIALYLILSFLTSAGQAQNPKEDYKLVWADEFNTNGAPDSANWGYENGYVRNHELQWYQKDNAVCRDGLLVIEARREEKDVHPYTSSCLITKGRRTWKYGRFELKARIDISSGIWPAWWTLGVEKHWPANGEIDIMEYYRKMLLANIACQDANGRARWFSERFNTDSMGGAAWASHFHVWRMDWTKTSIALYIDDHLLNKVPLDSLTNRDGSGFNPFTQPHYMLLNMAIGGDNGGDPAGTSFPGKFEIDYVRVYQKD